MFEMTHQAAQQRYDRQIAYWLLFCAGVIFAMILLGGVTRLTHSGLSMVEWKPIMGIVPPLSEADWQQLFYKYQQFPEYQKVNLGMTLAEFKPIFMYEYLHRVLGRFIGVIFVVPFIFFYISRRIPEGLTPKLLVMLLLGAGQGLLGWYMVKSGLVDNPRVSQYRLTAHLGNAALIYAFILWVAYGLLPRPRVVLPALRMPATLISLLIFIMILSGGLVAGTRAGYAYPTFPLMGKYFFPPELYAMQPIWLSAFEDITTIQFNHRIIAYAITAAVSLLVICALRAGVKGPLRTGILCMFIMMVIQVGLGISTLLLHMPVPLAAAHQVGAIALLSASLFVTHSLYGPTPEKRLKKGYHTGETSNAPATAG